MDVADLAMICCLPAVQYRGQRGSFFGQALIRRVMCDRRQPVKPCFQEFGGGLGISGRGTEVVKERASYLIGTVF